MGAVTLLRMMGSVARSTAMQRIRRNGIFFYALVWTGPAVFGTLLVIFIYRDNPALRDYAIIGGIDADNDVSLRLHEKLGFFEAGRFPEVGRKFDRWLDLVLVQKLL